MQKTSTYQLRLKYFNKQTKTLFSNFFVYLKYLVNIYIRGKNLSGQNIGAAKSSCDEISARQNFRSANIVCGKNFARQNFHAAKFSGNEISFSEITNHGIECMGKGSIYIP